MRIAISDRSPLIYMLYGEQLNVVSHEKDLLLPRRIGFWVSLVSPLNALTSIPYLYFIMLWFTQLLNMQIQLEDLRKSSKYATRLISSLRDLPYSE